eukprot:CAMPEP_0170565622 /NCGR_PEP_ID=MMETSP0211-20121228/79309_1 /TAXON_ID=311385 /ORGANISM="Pseudokeronopsis sp., Strain OXSARD2" /LENGTH=93 /DNA_ID=CAMNT_0010886551 /DNA_START=169 /DNA_END=451 /DNA_ORIENTATION=-
MGTTIQPLGIVGLAYLERSLGQGRAALTGRVASFVVIDLYIGIETLAVRRMMDDCFHFFFLLLAAALAHSEKNDGDDESDAYYRNENDGYDYP